MTAAPDDRLEPVDRADGDWSEPYDGDVGAERDRRPYVPEPILDGARQMRGMAWSVRIDRRCPACGIVRVSCGSRTCIRGAS